MAYRPWFVVIPSGRQPLSFLVGPTIIIDATSIRSCCSYRKPDSDSNLKIKSAAVSLRLSNKHSPCNFFVFSFSRLYLQAALIHLVDVSRGLHIFQDVVLKFHDWLQLIWDILVLLDVSYYLCRLGTFREVDQVRLLNDRGYTVFNEDEVSQIHPCVMSEARQNMHINDADQRMVCTEGLPGAMFLGTR